MDGDLTTAYFLTEALGHLASLLLVIALLMRSMDRLRLLVLASALLAIVYNLLWLQSPTALFWQTALLLAVLFRLGVDWRENSRASFSPEEQAFLDRYLPTLKPSQARKVLSEGTWITGKPGTVLTEQDKPVLFLVYLSEGEVDITCDGQQIGQCHPGNFVGELSLLHNAPASATATVKSAARYWIIPSIKMRDYRKSDPDIWNAFEAGLSQDLGLKIREMNEKATGHG